MLNALAICVAVAVGGDTLPPSPIVLAGAPRATAVNVADAPATSSSAKRPARALTPLESAMSRPRDYLADSLVLDKSERRLTVYHEGEKVRAYRVALGGNPVGAKQRRGDKRTPEGLYYIEGRNPRSKYYLSLRISYPSARDRERASRLGVSPGGDIMIHGLPKAFASVGALHREQDWTEGCVAVTNEEIEELWRSIPDGVPILITPE